MSYNVEAIAKNLEVMFNEDPLEFFDTLAHFMVHTIQTHERILDVLKEIDDELFED